MGVRWLAPAALWLGVLVALPVAVHLLARRRRRMLRFPTLRFLDAASTPARRDWRVRDAAVLAVRVAALLAIAAAVAGPVIVTPARQARWDAQVARAIVVDASTADDPAVRAATLDEPAGPREVFVGGTVRQGLADASAWLAAQPVGRREIVVVGPLPRGSVTGEHLRDVPAGTGLRFVRAGALPPATHLRARVQLSGDRVWRSAETVTFTPSSTTVREASRERVDAPVLEARAASDGQRAADAAARAVLRRGVAIDAATRLPLTAAWTGDVDALAAEIDALTAATGDPLQVEPEPMDEDTLQGFTRPASPGRPSDPVDAGDRRVVWALVLVLLGLESWMRRRPV